MQGGRLVLDAMSKPQVLFHLHFFSQSIPLLLVLVFLFFFGPPDTTAQYSMGARNLAVSFPTAKPDMSCRVVLDTPRPENVFVSYLSIEEVDPNEVVVSSTPFPTAGGTV